MLNPITAQFISGKSIQKSSSYCLPEPNSTSRLAIFENLKTGRGGNRKAQIYRYGVQLPPDLFRGNSWRNDQVIACLEAQFNIQDFCNF